MVDNKHDRIVRNIAMKEAMDLKLGKDQFVQFRQRRKVYLIKRIK